MSETRSATPSTPSGRAPRTASVTSAAVASTVVRAPRSPIRRRSSPRTTAITSMPRAAASRVRRLPTPPAAPTTSRLPPGRTPLIARTWAAAVPAVGSAAADRSASPPGTRATGPSWCTDTYSA
ncbi:hypothetical protein ACFQ60_26255 [Streptomyces zhihengii]